MMAWLSASVAALALALLVSPFLIHVGSSAVLRASERWRGLASWHPLATLIVVGAAPLLMGLAMGIGAFWPGALGHVLHLCHCGTGNLHAGHSSVFHPELSATLLPYSTILIVLLMGRPVLAAWRSNAAQRTIHRTLISGSGEYIQSSGVGVRLVEMGQANAFAAGFFRPKIYVDRSWWQSLAGEERRIVAAHERSHQRHRDPLALLVGRIVGGFLSPQKATRLLALLVMQMESRADLSACESTGDAIRVADFLLRQHREPTLPATALAFFGPTMERRIEVLIDVADGRGFEGIALWQWLSLAGAAGLVVSAFVVRGFFHRAAEFLLSIF